MVMVLAKEENAKWSVDALGNFFTSADVAGSHSSLVGAWWMKLNNGAVQPSQTSRPMEFIFREKMVLEPGQIKLLTVGL